jgi:hypothetical protein
VTAQQAAALRFLESIRTFIALGRLVHVNELSEAQDDTLNSLEQILDSLEKEMEDETSPGTDSATH